MTADIISENNEPILKGVYHPWRRYFARMLDISIYTMLWNIFLIMVVKVNINNKGFWEEVLDIIISTSIMLFIEPLLLKLFKTTPGKAIFGLKIETSSGHPLTYKEGLDRTWELLGKGMGYRIPFYNLYRLWKSYELCQEQEETSWDNTFAYSIKDTKWYRTLLWALANLILFGIIFLVLLNQQIPPNKGNLTIETFVDNYNYYSNLFEIDSGEYYLDSTGNWAKKPDDGTFTINLYADVRPEYDFVVEKDTLKEVSLSLEIINNTEWIGSDSYQILLAALAFGGAQEDVNLFSGFNKKMAAKILNNMGEPFEFVESGIQYTYEVESQGYNTTDGSVLIPNEASKENYYSFKFTVKKLD